MESVFSLSIGKVVLTWETLPSPEEIDDIEAWLALQMRALRRYSIAAQPRRAEVVAYAPGLDGRYFCARCMKWHTAACPHSTDEPLPPPSLLNAEITAYPQPVVPAQAQPDLETDLPAPVAVDDIPW